METNSPPMSPGSIYGVRSRVDAMLTSAVETVEREGITTAEGKPHPLLAAIPALLDAVNGTRRLALDRKAYDTGVERRPHS
ncbi:hypothetical protein OG840_03145 [Streptomyces sp. NBC_01764]|uniref:hypothetical protein n=1 Tax=Streptomyces sp. NBC_01764 TaxID=2975935 RepID=UPI002252867B|nr:hypothetical protein [Streptomyces sp. NBC_01764]MCX4400818.1 hypothetical protein [Streptomyces sp. NBC_01764]